MCGVIGLAKKYDGNDDEFSLRFDALMSAARIRGLHATGYAYYNGASINSNSAPVSQYRFPIPDFRNALCAIGHCRYSTSSLVDNQPIFDAKHAYFALVHNGVVSQDSPTTWEKTFDVLCKTENDSEIIYRNMLVGNAHPLVSLPESSQACISLYGSEMAFWRNTKRPLYYQEDEKYLYVASTRDILCRADISLGPIKQCKANVIYTFNSNTNQLSEADLNPYLGLKEDLQNATI
jgi:glutamine phosphoribosylpyrophosphate amidotransferase